jgi:cellulose synthase/poly-beta-1,6-N-acetylglucosamine synthase-like glycosyltransferase
MVVECVKSALEQNYPEESYEVAVISDRMSADTNSTIASLGANVIVFEPESSSKAKALNHAITYYNEREFDGVVILDADNIVKSDFICTLNDAFNSGCRVVQAHRTAKNTDTEVALLDAISEEINNSIFRKGHISVGLPSALIGSGMAFDYSWFKQAVSKLETAGEDKELEILILKKRVFIYYLDDLLVYDEKTKRDSTYYNQRRRWIAAQLHSLLTGVKWLPNAILSGNVGFIDKIFQWSLLPRVATLGFLIIIFVLALIINPYSSLKWSVLAIIFSISLISSIPLSLREKITLRSLFKLPVIFILTILNFFRTKGAVRRLFTHLKISNV